MSRSPLATHLDALGAVHRGSPAAGTHRSPAPGPAARLARIALAAVTVVTALTVTLGSDAASASVPQAKRPVTHELAAPIVARALGSLPVYERPTATTPTSTLAPTTEFGSRTVVLATARQGKWYRVTLPVRPNGASGWIHRRNVELRTVQDEIHVDLVARRLTWRHGGVVVLETPVAVGASGTETPTGRFYVTDLLDNRDDAGPYGPFAIGLAAHSDTLTEFAGGDGQIGIHGTNVPSSIGQAASHGCVRVPNEVVTRLANELPLGTPVTIV